MTGTGRFFCSFHNVLGSEGGCHGGEPREVLRVSRRPKDRGMLGILLHMGFLDLRAGTVTGALAGTSVRQFDVP